MEPYRERSVDAPENPFQSPTTMSALGGPPSDARRPDLPGTVIGVIVCVSLLGMLTLASALINPFGVPVGLAITVTVLIGIVKGRAWGHTMALTLAFIVLGATALFAFGGLLLLAMGRPGAMGLVLPFLVFAVPLHAPMVLLFYTRSARRFFGV